MYCRQCGKEVKTGVRFCAGCGAAIGKATPRLALPRGIDRKIWLVLGTVVGVVFLGVSGTLVVDYWRKNPFTNVVPKTAEDLRAASGTPSTAASPAESAEAEPEGEEGSYVRVTTDVLDLDINKIGAVIEKANIFLPIRPADRLPRLYRLSVGSWLLAGSHSLFCCFTDRVGEVWDQMSGKQLIPIAIGVLTSLSWARFRNVRANFACHIRYCGLHW